MKQYAPRGQTAIIVLLLVVLLAAAGAIGLVLRGGGEAGATHSDDAFLVRRGDFDIVIPVSGELAAMKQIEIRNRLDSRAIITEIVAEGTFVKAGDVLMRLNDEEIRNQLRDQQDRVNTAEAALISAQANLEIKIKTREAELAKADLAIQLADLALRSWNEGEVVSRRKELELAVETAEKEYERLAARFAESKKLLEKRFISLDEYKQDEIALMRADANLVQARLDMEVYEKYQYIQDKKQKESDLEQAKSERERIQQQYDAEVRTAQSEVDSKQYQLDSAKEKLEELREQLRNCVVVAPSPGLVVYYSSLESGNRRNDGQPPQVGTELYPNEPVMILPDTTQMIATVKVSEALSGLIKPGQRATVTSDAMPHQPIMGEVLSIGVLAESGGWRDPNRRDYTVRVLLENGADLGLKPAMRCRANIYVDRVEDSLHVPVQAVFRNGPLAYVYVPQDGGYAQRKVAIGRASELYIEIKDGVNEGDLVLLYEPANKEIVARLPMPKDEGPGRRGPGGRPPGMQNDGTDESQQIAADKRRDDDATSGEAVAANAHTASDETQAADVVPAAATTDPSVDDAPAAPVIPVTN